MYGGNWIIFVLPALIFAGYAQRKITNTFSKYLKVPSHSGLNGYQLARFILDRNGLENVRIEQVAGNLTDHYDPRTQILRLSQNVYSGSSIASVSVAAHEVGHAIQHSEGYFPLMLRNNIAPIVNISSRMVWIFIILGFLISPFFINIGIGLFLAVVLFQIVTLPVELNASNRAMLQLEQGLVPNESLKAAREVLDAAALTYVAATLVAVGQFFRLLSMTNRRR